VKHRAVGHKKALENKLDSVGAPTKLIDLDSYG
jgi:hypothetical protein